MKFKINHILIEGTRHEEAQTRVQVWKLYQGMRISYLLFS
jgi:hypothetical protein